MMRSFSSRLVCRRRRGTFAAILAATGAMVIGCGSPPADPPPDAPPDPWPDSEFTKSVQKTIFAAPCRCHWGLDASANLELYAPGLEARLIGRPSTMCPNLILVVPGDPDGSYLVRKLADVAPTCGERMPFATGTLSADDMQAVRDWVTSIHRPQALR